MVTGWGPGSAEPGPVGDRHSFNRLEVTLYRVDPTAPIRSSSSSPRDVAPAQTRAHQRRDAAPADPTVAAPDARFTARLDATEPLEVAAHGSAPEGGYWPPEALDRRPLVRSTPEDDALAGMPATGMPIRVRIYVDDRGAVTDVRVLVATDEDLGAAQRICDMFRDTAFIPGRRAGRDVASYIDVEVEPEPRRAF